MSKHHKNPQEWRHILDVYSLETILEMNDMEEWEILEILYEEGFIDLPPEPCE